MLQYQARTRSIIRSLQWLTLAALAAIIGITAQQLWQARLNVIRNATEQVARLDMVFAEQTGRAMETIDLTLRNLADLTPERVRTNPADASALLARRVDGVHQLAGLAVADASGTIVASSSPAFAGLLPAAGMAALALHRAEPEAGARISEPLRDRDGQWLVLLTRRLSSHDGALEGMTVGYVSMAYFEDFYRAVDLAENGSILLHRRDGTVLARFPRADGIIGTSYAREPPFADILAHQIAGTVVMTSPIDGSQRILAIRALKAYPLAVSVSVGEAEVLRAWWDEVWIFTISALAGALGLIGVLMLLSHRARNTELVHRLRTVEELARAASLDPVTGLLNRITLIDRFERLLAQAEATRSQATLLFLDLDRFKPINDMQGHKAGDAVLRIVGRRIVASCSGADVARWGGDEFVIVAGVAGAPEQAAALAARILQSLSDPIDIGGQTLRIEATIGLAMYPQDGRTPEALMSAADAALDDGKRSGGNTVRIFDPVLAEAVADALDLERSLRQALDADALALEFQPIIEMPGQRCAAFEALLRWTHPTRGAISPAVFIPLAEHSGLIGRLGRWVLHQACREAAGWPDALDVAVTVNVSLAQITSGLLMQDVADALAASGLPARRLHLEMTESMVGSDHLRIVCVLSDLRQLGVRIALDDFGTGFSSLSRLRTWPVDIIKIDQSFVQAMDRDGTAVIRAILLVAQEYNLEVTVEGVETTRQWHELASLGLRQFQGYLFSRPLTAAGVLPWLEAMSTRPPPRDLDSGGPAPVNQLDIAATGVT